MSSYHIKDIKKGVVGNFSKVREEFEELSDAYDQQDKILQICELTDLIGAIEAYSEQEFGLTLSDLKTFSDKTKKAFQSGKR